MVNSPLVSIVTPVFNGQKYIEDSILSVFNQSYGNYEYIIVDGKSTDNTLSIIKNYTNIVCISEKDKGQCDALNKGFKIAKGELILWLNSDDFLMPNCLEKYIELYSKYPYFDFYYSNYLWVDKYKKVLKTIQPYKRYSYFLNSFYGCYIPTSGSLMNKSFFEKVGYLDLNFKYKMDTDIFERSKAAKIRFKKINKTLSAFRFHGENVSFKDITHDSKDISKQDLESIMIKDRFFKIKMSLQNRNTIYKLIWPIFRFLYLLLKYSKI